MKVKLLQQHTIGDVIFLQKAIDIILSLNHDVYLPNDNLFFADYINKPNLYFKDIENPDKIINFHNVIEPNHPFDIMTYKYEIVRNCFNLKNNDNTSYHNWQKHVILKRNIEKENDLFYNVLNLKDGEEYLIKNCIRSKNIIHNIETNSNLKIIEMKIMPNFSFFDWSKVIENAKEIWTIDTAINYLIEVLDTKADRLVVYPRHEDNTKKALQHIWYKNWEWK
jgi:hypothetical protein